jgi:Uma2 family endonuclease
MSTLMRKSALPEIEYPVSDGKPMAETMLHAEVLVDTREKLVDWFQVDPMVFVWGNFFVCYVEGDPRKHLAPDVFVIRGVPKLPLRDNYLVWKERIYPQAVIEVTSKTTAKEDQVEKLGIYRDIWKVQEYFLFDPRSEYLKPPLQGHRLRGNRYIKIKAVAGRLPSEVLGLHLERDNQQLRLYDPISGQYLRTAREKNALAEAARQQAEVGRQQAEAGRQQAEMAQRQAEAARQQAEAELEREALARQQTEAERQREVQARQQAEVEIEKLRSQLETFRRQSSK